MSVTVLRFPMEVATDQYFGGCPHCGGSDGFLNDGSQHWFFCDRHKTKWCAGSNIFEGWREEAEELRRRNRFRLAEFMKVQPVVPHHDGRGVL